MSEWKYPGDEVVHKAFVANVLAIIKEKGLTVEEFEQGLQNARTEIDAGVHERAFGQTIRRLRRERNLTRKSLAGSAGLPTRVLIQIEQGQGGSLISVPEVCRIAVALNLRPHELMAHYQDAVKQADSSQAWW